MQKVKNDVASINNKTLNCDTSSSSGIKVDWLGEEKNKNKSGFVSKTQTNVK